MNEQFIQDNFCDAEISQMLKEVGFNEPCLAKWNSHGIILTNHITQTARNSNLIQSVAAPLYQQAIRWINTKSPAPDAIIHKDGLCHNFKDIEMLKEDIRYCLEWIKSQQQNT